ncbi:TRPA1 protein, partial [Amia calva]|nr:TRPA1 protein [Amia calva]
MKPSSLKRHLETKHTSLVEKPTEYFERQLEIFKRQKEVLVNSCSKTSYLISLRIAKCRKDVGLLLCNSRTNSNLEGDLGNTPSMLACSIDNHEAITILANCDKSTALHFACTQGATEAVKLMLSSHHHVEDVVNIIDGARQTPLHKATIFDHVELAEYLILKGANIDSIDCKGLSPLLLATSCGAWRTVELLLQKGANMKIKDKMGCNFLHLAVLQPKGLKNLCEEIFKVMCNVKKLLDDEDNEGCTPLHYACRLGISDSVNNMLGLKVSLNLKSKDKKSVLHFAAQYGRINTCRRLLETTVDTRLLNEGDDKGLTPLHLTSQGGHIKVVDLLLRKGALFLTDHKGWTCLHYAAAEGYTQTMKILLATNINLMDKADEDGNTALHLAAKEGHAAAVKMLLSKGAAFLLNKSEASFLHEAIHRGRKDVVFAVIDSDRVEEAILTFKLDSVKTCAVLEMIEFLPEACEFLLDKNVKESEDDVNSPDYSVSILFSRYNTALFNVYITCAMVKFNRIELLTHPLCKKYLEMKWLAYGIKAHILNLAIYTLGILPLSLLIVKMRPSRNDTLGDVTMPSKPLIICNLCLSLQQDYFLTSCMMLVLVMNVYAVIKEFVQMSQQRWRYFIDPSNLLDWVAAVFSILFVIPLMYNLKSTLHWQAGAIAVYFSWVNFLLYLQRFERFGIYVVMFREILRTLLCIILLFFFLILAFALSFYALMVDQTNFQTIPLTIMQTLVMMVGEISYQDNFLIPTLKGKLEFPVVTFIIFVLFVLLMPILLMNLLIGLAVGDIAEVQKNACLKRIAMQIDLHTSLEEKLPYWFMRRVDQETVTVYPNKVCVGKYVHSWQLHFLLGTGGQGKARSRLGSSSCPITPLENELQRQKYRLKDISSILEKQHNLLKLIIQKMDITSEADEYDGPDLFQDNSVKRQLLHKKSKWEPLLKAVRGSKP